LEDNQRGGCCLDPKNSRQEFFFFFFVLRNFWGKVSHYAATPVIVALPPDHTDITRFHPWSPIMTGYHSDHAKKIPKFAQTTDTVDTFDPCSGTS
jgi:hypothetical protein